MTDTQAPDATVEALTEARVRVSLCDHPTSARVFDTMGWSCTRCEQFIDNGPPREAGTHRRPRSKR